MDRVFDPDFSELEVVAVLSKNQFRRIGEGSSAYVFGDTGMRVVTKIFPPLSVGNPQELEFMSRNSLLRHADILTARWQRFRAVKRIRQKVRSIVAIYRSTENLESNKRSSESCIKAYELSIRKGLMKGLPTRVISNCVAKLSLKSSRILMDYFEQADKIVLQKRFQEKDLVMNVLTSFARRGDIETCGRLIRDAVHFQVSLWRLGLTDADMSFNMFDSLLLLPDGRLQIHDVNGIVDSYRQSIWYIREKEKDIEHIYRLIRGGQYPKFLYTANLSGISETARKLHGLVPKQNRDELVMLFLNLSREILSEEVMARNWHKGVVPKAVDCQGSGGAN